MHLASISSQEENDRLEKYIRDYEENCLELWNRDGKGLKWNDSPCSFETYFVCEVQPN
ncbi:hypothetical protein GQX74_004412 [Glossina fuscipes]|uniref:C-type lectin domain-containing protein n=1 Tax=Glossina palpalis gambiensis TaxID=67801 RepID=A0A1B0AZ32_9MUSC|nr:hypothetical protein GQX74_004412 [Glossina fuscipes]